MQIFLFFFFYFFCEGCNPHTPILFKHFVVFVKTSKLLEWDFYGFTPKKTNNYTNNKLFFVFLIGLFIKLSSKGSIWKKVFSTHRFRYVGVWGTGPSKKERKKQQKKVLGFKHFLYQICSARRNYCSHYFLGFLMFDWAAARRAIGTLYGEQET